MQRSFLLFLAVALLCPSSGLAGSAVAKLSGDVATTALYLPQPEYPAVAGAWLANGRCYVTIYVDRSSGKVDKVEVTRSTGNPVLDDAATAALKRWLFKPGSLEPHWGDPPTAKYARLIIAVYFKW